MRAAGTFRVTISASARSARGAAGDPTLATLRKRFRGDLSGVSRGWMLSVMGTLDGSAAYVALEIVQGTLAGRRGSFALQHAGTLDRGKATLRVQVVPDSGTDGLTGITGSMRIEVRRLRHSYVFDYALPRTGGPPGGSQRRGRGGTRQAVRPGQSRIPSPS
ncbi:MAG: DUF3224 domain-containing protein [Thermoplasmata archaeon]|nr:DUF3224 domain-containing protein [Thermoplasmata archaeon]MCI4358926.1 DUF3224 domain-containing protein [Thermoplasmata archaeon]